MKRQSFLLFLVLLLVSGLALTPFTAAAASKKEAKFFKNVPVSGTLADGGSFKGKLTITEFNYDVEQGLIVSGFLHGTATTADGVVHKNTAQSFTNVHASLVDTAAATGAQIAAICEILDLDIGAIHLDLLGLVVDLAPVHLDITAVSGAGNLLGNLLCAVVGLLDPGGFLGDLLNLNLLLDILRQINAIIG
jgi:hypothetical protein